MYMYYLFTPTQPERDQHGQHGQPAGCSRPWTAQLFHSSRRPVTCAPGVL